MCDCEASKKWGTANAEIRGRYRGRLPCRRACDERMFVEFKAQVVVELSKCGLAERGDKFSDAVGGIESSCWLRRSSRWRGVRQRTGGGDGQLQDWLAAA